MKRNSFISYVIQLTLGVLISSVLLHSVNEFNLQVAWRYCCVGALLLLLNRSRSLAEFDSYMLIVGLIISTCGLIALFFSWSLSYEVCLLGGIFTVIGYISYVNQLSEFRLFEYTALLFLFCCMVYLIFKLASWQGTEIIEIVGLTAASFLFLVQDTKKKADRSTTEVGQNSHNKMLV